MRFRISFVLLSLVAALPLSNQALADNLRCSDLSEHEAVLKDGRDHVYAGGSISPLMEIPDNGYINDATPPKCAEAIQSVTRWWEFMEAANAALLDTPTQIKSARYLAKDFEMKQAPLAALQCDDPSQRKVIAAILERFDPSGAQLSDVEKVKKGGWSLRPALRLYERILESPPWKNGLLDSATTSEIVRAITRIKTFRSAEKAQSAKDYSKSLLDYNAFVAQVNASPEIDLETRSKLLENVSANITSDFINAEPASEKLVRTVTTQGIAVKRGLECLQMADDLNATGGKLEAQLSWDLALKMYNEALAIRIKNIGADSEEAICEYVDIGRVKAAQGKISEACTNYEKAINYFRKQKNKTDDYPRALESYADILNKAKQTTRANSIYEEARAYYRHKDNRPIIRK
jgi:tetratricopeptide (TPR) repeat protein